MKARPRAAAAAGERGTRTAEEARIAFSSASCLSMAGPFGSPGCFVSTLDNLYLKLILTLLAGLTVFDPACSDESIKRSEYNRMPPMFVYDQYDECLFSDPDEVVGTYCMVRVVVKPDNASSIWRLIETFSSNTKLHMNHALLDRGICVIDVAETIARLKVDNISALVVPKFEIEFPYIYRYNSFRNVEPYKKNYSDLMAAIVNTDLTERYGLQAYTEIEYCDRTGVDEFPIDGVDIAFLVFIADLIIAVIASSYYDASWKSILRCLSILPFSLTPSSSSSSSPLNSVVHDDDDTIHDNVLHGG
ncbi:conserved hypothetical protein [Culex quinquefasciatus]|uniref:Uncharacterized protein n=1 Tax=Culex quinquefasciatus TaxID=7176 RepID=B0XK33_CULQU|nr:conserved hypothetical protein [Culex quinquefasciatus]|eukprot:XP_001870005.1 conserved hypothetical protein [Culex quinquefasciatus]